MYSRPLVASMRWPQIRTAQASASVSKRRLLNARGSALEPERAPRRPSSLPWTAKLESREPLRDQRGMEYAILIPSAFGYHPVTVFNLARINVIDLFTAVLLADPFCR